MAEEKSKYGRRHDRLGKKAKKLDDESMDPNNPISDEEFKKKQDKVDKIRGKRKKIRDRKDGVGKTKAVGQMSHGGKKDGVGKMQPPKKREEKKRMSLEEKRALRDFPRDSGKKEEPVPQMSRELTYGGPVIDQMGNALSHMGAHKVLKHMKSKF